MPTPMPRPDRRRAPSAPARTPSPAPSRPAAPDLAPDAGGPQGVDATPYADVDPSQIPQEVLAEARFVASTLDRVQQARKLLEQGDPSEAVGLMREASGENDGEDLPPEVRAQYLQERALARRDSRRQRKLAQRLFVRHVLVASLVALVTGALAVHGLYLAAWTLPASTEARLWLAGALLACAGSAYLVASPAMQRLALRRAIFLEAKAHAPPPEVPAVEPAPATE